MRQLRSKPASNSTSVLVVTASIVAVLAPCAARAACNAIPDPRVIFGAKPPDAVARRLPYRGAIGRVDRPIVRAAVPRKRGGFATEHFTIGADSTCKTPRIAATVAATSPRADEFVILLGFPPAADLASTVRAVRPTPFVVWASPELHDQIRADAQRADGEVRLVGILGTAGVTLTRIADTDDSDYVLDVEYPDASIFSADTDDDPLTGPARIVVLRAGEHVPFARATRPCAEARAGDDFRPLICIDSLYSDSFDRCGTSEAGLHPGICNFVGGGKRMSFAKQCFPGSGASAHPGKCAGEPDGLDFVVTTCGSVLFEFDWRDILDAGNAAKKRRLRGSSALSPSGVFEDGPIRIPGREFLASLPSRNGPGNPHKPDFAPDGDLGADAQELTLIGAVEEPESTLFLYPRMKAAKLCKSGQRRGQACTGVDGDKVVCACDLESVEQCECDDLAERDARYFECVGLPERDKQPCTRASHCWVGGKDDGACSGKPICVPLGTVWRPGIDLQGSECERDEQCGKGRQCGYSLFELRWRGELGGRRIPYLIPPGSIQRGVCEKERSIVCGGAAGPCVDNTGPCTGYRLEALGLADDLGGPGSPVPAELFEGTVPPEVHLSRGRLIERDDDDLVPAPGVFVYGDEGTSPESD